MKKLIDYFIPAKFKDDNELVRRARFTIWFLLILWVVVIPTSAFIIYMLPDKLMNLIVGTAFVLIIAFIIFAFRKTGAFWLVSVVFGTFAFVGMCASLLTTGGIYSPDMYSFVLIPLVGLIVSDMVVGLVYVGLTFAAGVVFFLLDQQHVIPFHQAAGSLAPSYYLFDFIISSGLVYIIIFRNEKLRLKLLGELRNTNKIVSEKNKEITDSINYAKFIQQGILPADSEIKKYFPEHFVLYKPKDIVSGDFYWCGQKKNNNSILNYIAAVDCTGHGVPGAFMSMLGYSLLNQALNNSAIISVNDILNYVNRELPKVLKSEGKENSLRDGMDISLCAIDFEKQEIFFSGANNPLWILRKNEMVILKSDKQAISASEEIEKKSFSVQQFKLEKGDCIYLFTDGYADQFGGTKGKKFKYKQLSEKLKVIGNKVMGEQKEILGKTFEEWKGGLEQVDDVCIIGIMI